MRTEVAALAKTFDYAVPAALEPTTCVSGPGCACRSTGAACGAGWSRTTSATPEGVDLLPLKSWLGWGPPPDVVELAEWASWRWAGPASFFLHAASPSVVVRALPHPPPVPAAPVTGAT